MTLADPRREFETGQEPPREPVGMNIVGTGVIFSCLLLSALFAWGIYLNLTQEPCTCPALEAEQTISLNPPVQQIGSRNGGDLFV